MSATPKFQILPLIMALVLSVICSCSKKQNLTQPNNIVSPTAVYDVKNNAAIYPTTGMAVDASGNLYTTDVSGFIKMYTPAGASTIIAGNGTAGSKNGPGATSSFNWPSALAIDAAKNIYV